ncbi:MAG: hypothetical protein H7301_09830, partial [Cryobacterium sp.]|nr:hypothetical protein [Oligoflexia bacterium]
MACLATLACFSLSPNCEAKEIKLKPIAPLPAPNTQARKIPENPFRCDRIIRYQGKSLPCDSALRRDGEGLRTILEANPDALEELERYQSGRQSVQFAAYTGTAGLVLVLASGILTDLFIDESRVS